MTSDAPIQTLLVDTNSGDARRVSQALAHAPFAYELTHVVSLTDALDSTRERSHDVVLFDLGESEEAGIESFVTLIESAPATPVVVFTGQGDDVSGLRALELGAQDYLTKPLTDIYSLHRSIRHAIHRHRLQHENRKRVARLEKAASTDSLTGVLNRRAFAAETSRLWETSDEQSAPVSCVMLDIDFFKLVNDQHGHLVGDDVLCAIAGILRENSRRGDCIARYGGEEFCVMLAGTCEDGAVTWAERIREAIHRLEFPLVEQTRSVTASFGVAQRTEDTTGVEHLIYRADEALLVAKQTGRNRVVSHGMLELATNEPCTSTATDPRFAGQLARHLMVPSVVCLTQEETLRSSAGLLMTLRLESAPIVDNQGRLCGVVSEDGIMAQLLAGDDWDDGLQLSPDSMPACFVSDTPISVIWDFLRRVPVRRVVIVEGKRPVGIISRSNLLRWLHDTIVDSDDDGWEGAHTECPASAELTDVIDRLSDELRRLRGAVRSSEDAAPLTLISASRMQDLLDLLLERSQRNNDASRHALVDMLQ